MNSQRDKRRQRAVMTHVCRLTVPVTVNPSLFTLVAQGSETYMSALSICPSINLSIISPQ